MDGQTRFTNLRRHLAALSPAQKLAAATIVLVMLGSAWWVNSPRVASRSGMEPILDQPFSTAELISITERLRTQKVPHEVRDGKVLVPADRRMDALSDLYYADALRGTEDGFDALVKQMSAWDSPSKTDKLFDHHREQAVQRVISRFAGVRKATVIIDSTSQRRMDGASIHPAAMVDIQTRQDVGTRINSQQLAHAAVNVLTGSLANLSRERVTVTIDGASYNLGDGSVVESRDAVERRQQLEHAHVAKLRQLLGYIPDVMVSVSVDLKQPQTEQASKAPAPVDPPQDALIANAVPVIAPPPLEVAPADDASGEEVVRSASIAVPRSYFLGIYQRASSRGSVDPQDALLQPVIDMHAARIRSLVKNALGLADDGAVTVEAYEDNMPVATAVPVPPPAASAAAMPMSALLLNTHAREIALGILAAVALLMMSILLRRAAAPKPVPATVPLRAMPAAVQERHGLLDGVVDHPVPAAEQPHHLDPHASQEEEAHQLFRRARGLVNENPDDAARVLRSWIYQDR